jgi:hypothetical protein
MDSGVIIIVFIRSLIPLTIFKYPLLGGVLSIMTDYVDMDILKLFGSNLNDYQQIDKILDMYYLSLEFYIVLSWKNLLAKRASILLFCYRLLGILLFMLFTNGIILVIFPNLFEFFYLFYLGFKKLHKFDPITSFKSLATILFLLLIPKLIHEYLLHVNTTYPWTQNKYVKLLITP